MVVDKDSIAILNLAMDHAVGSDTTWRYHLRLPPMPPPAPGNRQDSFERTRFIKWKDSLKAILDTATLFVVVYTHYDTLGLPEQQLISETANIEVRQQDKHKDDTTFHNLMRKLISLRPSKDSINLFHLKPGANYTLYPKWSFPKDNLKQLGSLQFSKIAFNNSKDKACVYSSFICGNKCGQGVLHFLEKKKGNWKYVKNQELWVS